MKAKFAITIVLIFLIAVVNAQITELSNTAQTVQSITPEYVGWNGQGNFPKDLDIRSGFGSSYNMNFFTNGNPGR